MTLSIHDLAQTRVTTKHYSGEALDRETVRAILDAARLAPTSVNAQCTKLFVASTPEAREKIAPAFADFNRERVIKASDIIVFAVCDGVIPDEHFKRVLAKEIEDGRYAQAEIGPQMDAGRRGFAAMQSKTPERCIDWQARQAYMRSALRFSQRSPWASIRRVLRAPTSKSSTTFWAFAPKDSPRSWRSRSGAAAPTTATIAVRRAASASRRS